MIKQTLLTVTLLLVATGLVIAESGEEPTTTSTTRIGIYDSRAIAIAYAGSDHLKEWLAKLKQAQDRSRAAGNEHWVGRLESVAEASRQLLHDQAVGSAPVNDLLAIIIDDLPDITEEAGVVTLISKWDEDSLAGYPDAEKVDVTMRLVDAFNPSEKARENAKGVQGKDPAPIETLKGEATAGE